MILINNLKLKTNKPDKGPKVKRASKWRNIKHNLFDFWNEFRRIKYGIVGLVVFLVFLLMVILEPYIIPFKSANERWRDISYWDANPRSAAPVWTNWFSSKKKALHAIIDDPELETKKVSGMQIMKGTFTYNYKYDEPPRDIVFKAVGRGTLSLSFTLIRPDGNEVLLAKKTINTSELTDIFISLSNESVREANKFIKKYEKQGVKIFPQMVNPTEVFFARAQRGIYTDPKPLKGDYRVKFAIAVMGKDAILKDPTMIFTGRVFGLLGTDSTKRDIFSGILAGIKWAILIGLLTSFVSVTIGVIYGVICAYFGGWVDALLMRIFEIFLSMPLLPVLIVMSAVFKPSIWTLIFMMCAFFWTGPVKTVRSMGLQIKEETYVEAAKALDASHARIIFKHMVPQLIPFAFATMALRVPIAILYEASISLLGLGDATIVTWGQILHDAMHNGAVFQGIWWWVVPPGLFIALMGMTFAFMGFAMDTILNPKLRTR